jgi:DNA primase large subunit
MSLYSTANLLKYPFSREAREASQKLARDLGNLADFVSRPANEYIVKEAEERVLAALTNSSFDYPAMQDERDVLIYPTSRLIVESIGNMRLRVLQAVAEEKTANRFLDRESPETLTHLCETSFGWSIQSMGDLSERAGLPLQLRTYEFKIRFENFLEVAPSIRAPEWNLINRYLSKGWVPIRKSELVRLASGRVHQIIMAGRLDLPPLSEILAAAIERLSVEMPTHIRQFEPLKFEEVEQTAFPPCMAQLHFKQREGEENLPHFARFALAAFLNRINVDRGEILSLFEQAPDRHKRIITYQVDHISGQLGGKKSTSDGESGYMPPNCDKIRSQRLCPVDLGQTSEPLCEYILNPLSFYSTRFWETTNNVTNRSWYARKWEKKQTF